MASARVEDNGVWNPGPRRVEIHIYENRFKDHVVVMTRDGQDRIVRVPRAERADFSDEETIHAIRFLLQAEDPDA